MGGSHPRQIANDSKIRKVNVRKANNVMVEEIFTEEIKYVTNRKGTLIKENEHLIRSHKQYKVNSGKIYG